MGVKVGVNALVSSLLVGGLALAIVLGFIMLPLHSVGARLLVTALLLAAEGILLLAVVLPVVVWKSCQETDRRRKGS